MKILSFDQFKEVIQAVDAPAQRLGIFNVAINNYGKKYDFMHLKESVSFNKDRFGFSLNHSYQPQKYKQSKFHDWEDISVGISREEFITANEINDTTIEIKTKTFKAIVTW